MFLRVWIYLHQNPKRRMIERGRILFQLSFLWHTFLKKLLDVAALHDSRESICQLVHHDLGQVVARHAGNVTVTHSVLSHQDIISETRGIACGR